MTCCVGPAGEEVKELLTWFTVSGEEVKELLTWFTVRTPNVRFKALGFLDSSGFTVYLEQTRGSAPCGVPQRSRHEAPPPAVCLSAPDTRLRPLPCASSWDNGLNFPSFILKSHVGMLVFEFRMSVMSSVTRGARRLLRADPALLHNFLSLPSLCPARSSAPQLTCQHNRKFASKQVKGQRKEQKKLKVKVDKQEVEIRQRMTVAALAAAMNKDFGKIR
ncbi:hypothetical protein EYF80_064800 [Liparis tanakae]|uniref:Uncharacterized protein n=1 Tax=Liparis tanakae TaxID=230148 RepID=A0A4Z2E8R9_9TELE|nr:hypothetical protein EYF80_064800 [Liparis tanakae]